MSSNTLREAVRDGIDMDVYGYGGAANEKQISDFTKRIRAALSLPAEGSGARDVYRRGVEDAVALLRGYKLPAGAERNTNVKTMNGYIEEIAVDILAHADSARAYAECGPEELRAPPALLREGQEALSAKEWAKTFWPMQPRCLGYEGGCDGDLPGEKHVTTCPMFGKQPVSLFEFAEAFAQQAVKQARVEALEEAQKMECFICAVVGEKGCRWSRANSNGKHFSGDGEERMCEAQHISRALADLREKGSGA